MRILIVGAGATGGYFGGRLLQHGRDVTFLVRGPRAAALARSGLVLHSPMGDATLDAPPTVRAFELNEPYDLILLSCKAYGLAAAVTDFAAAVGPQTAILPVLNGMAHLETLDQRFGSAHVLGGRCMIAATLDENGGVQHLNRTHTLTFGERDGTSTPRLQAIIAALSRRRLRCAGEQHHHAGHVGQMGVPGDAGRHYLSAACIGRQHRGCARRHGCDAGVVRRMLCGRRACGPYRQRDDTAACTRHPDRGEFHVDRVDDAGFAGRPC